MAAKHQECFQCKSMNTELEVDEEIVNDDTNIIVTVWCLDCMTYSAFNIDEDWREYV